MTEKRLIAVRESDAAFGNGKQPLSQKQREMLRAFAQGDSSYAVAERVGVTKRYVDMMKAQPHFRAALAVEQAKWETESQMSRKKVMDGLMESIAMAKMMSEPMTMISGWREVGKLCGYYEPTKHKIDISVNGTVALERLNTLSDAELLQMITAASPQELLEGPEDGD